MLAAAIPPPFRDRIRAMHAYRTHNCSQLRDSEVGLDVRISGWVHRVRDHGGLLFVDLRDHYGMTQIVADPDSAAFAEIERLRPETVIRVDGAVRARTPDTVNPELDTGRIEVFCRELEILGPAEDLPLPVFGEPAYPEEIRLRYRYLDLRRPRLHRRIALRSRIISSLRRRMEAAGFLELQTPILTASSPEGARDFLVPSRLHPGKFYALPQAPQQYKQLTMSAGFDRQCLLQVSSSGCMTTTISRLLIGTSAVPSACHGAAGARRPCQDYMRVMSAVVHARCPTHDLCHLYPSAMVNRRAAPDVNQAVCSR